ncbi:retrovirus-related pol polyprotein from transposon TNT 1-94, partial [Tanacetum coccineum]
MFKLDIEPLSPMLKNNRDAHEVYIEKTIEYTDTFAFCLPKSSGKLVAVTSINKDKRVRFVKPVTSSNNIPMQTDSLKTKDSNKPLLTSTGVKPTTSASGSKPSVNTKNNRITRPPSSNQKNKVEDHSRKVKSSLKKKNSVNESISNALVKHSVRNAKFESMCAICNKCLFDANHDTCLIDFVNDVNVRSKAKYKRNKMRKAWKPMGGPDRPLVSGLRMFKRYDREPLSADELCVDLLSGSCDTNLYIISLDDMLKTSPICLLSKASNTKSWLWHRCLSHLNFGTLNKLAKDRSCTRTDNGTEFVNQTLRDFYENVGISHQTSVARTPLQNGVVERRNRTVTTHSGKEAETS